MLHTHVQDADGLISASDLQAMFESQGCGMWAGAADDMVRDASLTRPGFVTYEEFFVASYG